MPKTKEERKQEHDYVIVRVEPNGKETYFDKDKEGNPVRVVYRLDSYFFDDIRGSGFLVTHPEIRFRKVGAQETTFKRAVVVWFPVPSIRIV